MTLPDEFRSGKILALGLGGGCDAITAYVVAKCLPGLPHDSVLYGNTKRHVDGLTELRPHIFAVPDHARAPLVPGDSCYGSWRIDASLPPGPDNSPLIVHLPKAKGVPLTDAALHLIAEDIRSLGITSVVGVDAGGDSITGGIDHDGDPAQGVDQLMCRVLDLTGLPFLHVIAGPGCDGESSETLIRSTLDAPGSSKLVLVGRMDESWAALFEQHAGVLGPTRTPAIMASAIRQLDAPDSAAATVTVPRGLNPQISTALLASYFALRM